MTDEIQLYDSEKVELNKLKTAMQIKYGVRGASTVAEETAQHERFTNEMIHRCAELGFRVMVEWEWEDEKTGKRSPDVSDVPNDMNLYWNPRVTVMERIDKATGEFDHERQQHEVASGILDGKKGYIREDGTWHEEPLKKNIY